MTQAKRRNSSPDRPSAGADRNRSGVRRAAAALALLVWLTYGNALGGGFTLDSRPLVLGDARVHAVSAENVSNIFRHTYWWPRGESGLYRPATTLTYLVNYAVAGNAEQPLGYHALNVALHTVAVWLGFAVAIELFGAVAPAFAAAALWAVHPLTTEAVANIVGRADVLAAMAVFGAILCHVRAAAAPGGRRWRWRVGLFAIVAIGLLAKESAAIVAGAIVMFELCRRRDDVPDAGRDRLRATIVNLAVAAAGTGLVLLLRAIVLRAAPAAELPFTDNPIVTAPFWTGRWTAVTVLARYVELFVWPARLSCDYSYAAIPLASGTTADWLRLLLMAVLIAIAVVALVRERRGVAFGLTFAALAILPAASLLFPTGTVMAERLAYLPSFGLTTALVAAVWISASRRGRDRVAGAVLACMVLALGARSIVRNSEWADDLTIWLAAERAYPASYKPHKAIAGELAAADPQHRQIDRTIAEADRAVAILDLVSDADNEPTTFHDAAGYYLVKSDVALSEGAGHEDASRAAGRRAAALLRRELTIVGAIEARLGSPEARATGVRMAADIKRLLSLAELRAGDPGAALRHATEARTLEPLNPVGYQQHAAAALALQRPDEAAVALATGAMVTSNAGLRRALIGLYLQGLDPDGCAVTNGEALNPACPAVRRTMCAAAGDVVRIERQAGRADRAESVSAMAARDFGCEAIARQP